MFYFTGGGDFNRESHNNQPKQETPLQQNSQEARDENQSQDQEPFQFNSDSWNNPKPNESLPLEPKPSPWDRARGGFQDVYVSSVATPSNFWLQLVNAESVQLDQLQESITTYCNAQSKVSAFSIFYSLVFHLSVYIVQTQRNKILKVVSILIIYQNYQAGTK